MGDAGVREEPVARQQVRAPVAVAEPEIARVPLDHAGLGNAATARLLAGGGPSFAAAAMPGGNAAVSRAIRRAGEGPGQAPEGFAGRLPSAEAGVPIPDQARQTLEESFGAPLADVRLHVGGTSADLVADVGARAFTVGQDIYFGQGEFSPDSPAGYELLAHEVTHTLQQGGGGLASSTTVSSPADPSEREAVSVARQVSAERGKPVAAVPHAAPPLVARDVSANDLIPDFILDGIKATVSALPGYTLLTQIVGKDLITDQPVAASNEQLLESLLTFGPFGAGVAPVLRGMEIIGDIVSLVTSGLSEHNLTLTRISHDVGAAWDEVSVTNGIDGNAAIVRRYIDAILHDATAFVGSIVDRVIEIVRTAVAEVAEPHLETPEIKPVWDLARKVLHHDPLRGTDVDAPTVEILADFLRLIGEEQRLAQLQERGTLQEAADWLDTQFATFASITGELMQLFSDAWAAIAPQNLPHLLDTLPQLADRAFALVRRIGAFAATIIGKVLELVKKSLLGWLSDNAHRMPGFHLMTVMIERNPFTGESVPRTPENLIKGFITLMPNGEATYNQLAESGVIADAAGRITAAMTRLGISWDMVTGTFHAVWDMLTLNDLLAPVAAFERVLAKFGEPLGRILEFVTEVVKVVIELVLKLMNFPSDLLGKIINNAMQAIEDIKKDPVAFLMNMLQALKAGITGFFDDILDFLLQGLTSWLFRGLGQIGITIPPDVTLKSILDLVLQVLGVTVETLWQKLAKKIGPEKAAKLRAGVDTLTGVWQFIKDVQEGGVAAIWHHLVDKLTGLWDMLLAAAEKWIMTQIVEKITAKLISMLDPTGIMAVVNSFIAFFKAIQSAIDYLRDILMIVDEYVSTFAQVAAGNIMPGADKIKQGLGHAVPVAIGFLANQVGLGNVPEKIVEIIGGLRQLIDEALDWLFDKAFELGGAALNALGLGGEDKKEPDPAAPPTAPDAGPDNRTDAEKQKDLQAAAEEAHLAAQTAPDASAQAAAFEAIKLRRRLKSLEVIVENQTGQGPHAHIHAEINPTFDGDGFIISNYPPGPAVVIELDMGAPPGRAGLERVLAPPGQVGLPAGQWVRAHLVGQGFGSESPQGIFYAPASLNGQIQNGNIELAIRGLYEHRIDSSTRFHLTCSARPHPGPPAPRLAVVSYDLVAITSNGDQLELFQAEISVPDTVTPTPEARVGNVKINVRNIDRISDYENSRLGINA